MESSTELNPVVVEGKGKYFKEKNWEIAYLNILKYMSNRITGKECFFRD